MARESSPPPSATPFLPERRSLTALREAAGVCEGCHPPKKSEVDACLPWLREELRAVGPEALVLLGATAAKALLGSSFSLTASRGSRLDSELAPFVIATIHPSAILRSRDDEARIAERAAFTRDLETVAAHLAAIAA